MSILIFMAGCTALLTLQEGIQRVLDRPRVRVYRKPDQPTGAKKARHAATRQAIGEC